MEAAQMDQSFGGSQTYRNFAFQTHNGAVPSFLIASMKPAFATGLVNATQVLAEREHVLGQRILSNCTSLQNMDLKLYLHGIELDGILSVFVVIQHEPIVFQGHHASFPAVSNPLDEDGKR
eukprot:TRINITY_DN10380_c0_g2_i2.p2 TRINITY_DN10380_c0_g2~~TRINITY_DN10380_c0_g2_i2.p2  ORF type:complete len:121 (+),score=14.85 TRINITY_DN10380_c0_g2_i2:1523-1885(+)